MARHAGVTGSHVVNVNNTLFTHYLSYMATLESERISLLFLKTDSVAYLAILGRVEVNLFKSKARISSFVFGWNSAS